MKSLSKVGLAVLGLAVAVQSASTFAFTTSSAGFPIVETTDTTTMLSGVGSAGTGILNFMVSNWVVFVALAVAGAIVGLIMHFAGGLRGIVRGK